MTAKQRQCIPEVDHRSPAQLVEQSSRRQQQQRQHQQQHHRHQHQQRQKVGSGLRQEEGNMCANGDRCSGDRGAAGWPLDIFLGRRRILKEPAAAVVRPRNLLLLNEDHHHSTSSSMDPEEAASFCSLQLQLPTPPPSPLVASRGRQLVRRAAAAAATTTTTASHTSKKLINLSSATVCLICPTTTTLLLLILLAFSGGSGVTFSVNAATAAAAISNGGDNGQTQHVSPGLWPPSTTTTKTMKAEAVVVVAAPLPPTTTALASSSVPEEWRQQQQQQQQLHRQKVSNFSERRRSTIQSMNTRTPTTSQIINNNNSSSNNNTKLPRTIYRQDKQDDDNNNDEDDRHLVADDEQIYHSPQLTKEATAAAAQLEAAAGDLSERRRRAHVNSVGTTRAEANGLIDDGAGAETYERRAPLPPRQSGIQRQKRNLDQLAIGEREQSRSSSSGNRRPRPDAWHRNRRLVSGGADQQQQQQPTAAAAAQPAAVDQDKLVVFWLFFKGVYPSLAAYLFALSSSSSSSPLAGGGGDGGANEGQSTSTKAAVVRLLDEADRLLREHHPSTGPLAAPATLSNVDLMAARLNLLHGTGLPKHTQRMLNRIMSNPMYAKLIQHHVNQQRQPAAKGAERGYLLQAANSEALGGGGAVAGGRYREQSQKPAESLEADSGHVYGRIVHSPHELAALKTPISPARTLDKLRQLSLEHRNQQQQQQLSNEIDRTVPSQPEELESNRIPLIDTSNTLAVDAPTRGGGASGLDNNDDNSSIRNKFVYGSVLLRPAHSGSGRDGRARHTDPLATLRQLKLDRELAGGGLGDEPQQQQQTRAESTSESYGHILVSPPSLSGGGGPPGHRESLNSPLRDAGTAAERPASYDERSSTTGAHANWASHNKQSPLGKLRQQLNSDQFGGPMVGGGGGEPDSRVSSDELTTQQQRGFLAAVHSELAGEEATGGNDESNAANQGFVGFFHPDPLQQVEVRQLRGQSQSQPAIRLSSGHPNEFLVT